MAYCQKNVIGLLIFHVSDEADLLAWQSGMLLRRRHAQGEPERRARRRHGRARLQRALRLITHL